MLEPISGASIGHRRAGCPATGLRSMAEAASMCPRMPRSAKPITAHCLLPCRVLSQSGRERVATAFGGVAEWICPWSPPSSTSRCRSTKAYSGSGAAAVRARPRQPPRSATTGTAGRCSTPAMATRRRGRSGSGCSAGLLAGRPIRRVIGTHFHPDHVGLAGWLCERHRRRAADEPDRMADLPRPGPGRHRRLRRRQRAQLSPGPTGRGGRRAAAAAAQSLSQGRERAAGHLHPHRGGRSDRARGQQLAGADRRGACARAGHLCSAPSATCCSPPTRSCPGSRR